MLQEEHKQGREREIEKNRESEGQAKTECKRALIESLASKMRSGIEAALQLSA